MYDFSESADGLRSIKAEKKMVVRRAAPVVSLSSFAFFTIRSPYLEWVKLLFITTINLWKIWDVASLLDLKKNFIEINAQLRVNSCIVTE